MAQFIIQTLTSPDELPSLVRELRAALKDGPITIGVRPGESLTPAEAGQFLGVSRQFIDRLIAQGNLECVRLPGSTHRKILASEVSRFAQEREKRREVFQSFVKEMDDAGIPWE